MSARSFVQRRLHLQRQRHRAVRGLEAPEAELGEHDDRQRQRNAEQQRKEDLQRQQAACRRRFEGAGRGIAGSTSRACTIRDKACTNCRRQARPALANQERRRATATSAPPRRFAANASRPVRASAHVHRLMRYRCGEVRRTSAFSKTNESRGTGRNVLLCADACADGKEVGPGDAVICPAFTFCATAEVVALLGATPVFVDVDADHVQYRSAA